jgi:WbqC-like protein family
MIVSIHQPHFLPWLGYFNKVLHSDVFVWLDSVQYRKNYFQNRTRITDTHAQAFWLTVPVHAPLGTPISRVFIADRRWRTKVEKTIEQCYGKAPYFTVSWPKLLAAISYAPDNLDALNFVTFKAVLQLLGGDLPHVVRDEELAVVSKDPTVRLVEICARVGASHYIAGKGGHNYLRIEEFHCRSMEVIWQHFDPARVVYPQQSNSFVPGLSVLDCLFNIGPMQTRKLILNAWKP